MFAGVEAQRFPPLFISLFREEVVKMALLLPL